MMNKFFIVITLTSLFNITALNDEGKVGFTLLDEKVKTI